MFLGVFGNPLVMSLFVIAIFLILALVLDLGFFGMALVSVPVVMMIFAVDASLLPVKVIFGLIVGTIVGIALLRLVNR